MAANERWKYLVVSIKPSFFGRIQAALQTELDRQGPPGWELVSVMRPHPLGTAELVFKRPA